MFHNAIIISNNCNILLNIFLGLCRIWTLDHKLSEDEINSLIYLCTLLIMTSELLSVITRHNKLVLQLGTEDTLHSDSTFLLFNDKKKKSQNYLAYAVYRTCSLHQQRFETPCTVFTTIFYPS